MSHIIKLHEAALELAEPFKGLTGLHHDIKCLLCNNIFNATIKSKIQNFKKHGVGGCPKCTMDKRFKEEKESIKNTIKNLGFEILTDYRSKLDHVTARNTKCSCGRSWVTKPIYILSGRSFCKPCNDEDKAKRMIVLNDIKHKHALKSLSGFKLYKKKVQILSNKNFNSKDSKRSKQFHLDHIVPVSYCFRYNIPEEICSHPDNLRLIPAIDNIKKNTKISQNIPTIFKSYIKSFMKIDSFVKDVQELSDNFKTNKIVHGIHVTLYNEKNKIILCFFPLEETKQQNVGGRHTLSKIKKVLTVDDFKVLLIYEDEWDNKKSIILNKIKYMIGNSNRVYARKCTIRTVPTDDKSIFLNENHIQGNDKSSINYGLYHEAELMAMMTFSKPKIFMKGKRYETGKIQYELSRFCVKGGHSVVGGASRLLKQFIKDVKYDEIYSFADKRLSDGKLYETIGFEKEKTIDLDYAYILDNQRKHRWDFRKDRIKEKYPDMYDPNKTEYEMMLELGIDRVWDAGKIRYRLLKK